MVAYTTSTGTAPRVQQAVRQDWNLGSGQVTRNQSGEFVYRDPTTGLYMKTPDRAFAEQQASGVATNQATANQATAAGLTDMVTDTTQVADTSNIGTTGALNTMAAFTPTARQTANIQQATRQNFNLQQGQVTKNNSGEYVYRDPFTGVYMKTPNQQVAQYYANLTAENAPDRELLENPIVPQIGDWAQIGGVGSGFDWNPFKYNSITELQRPTSGSGYNFANINQPANYTYADYLNSLTPYSGAITPGNVYDYATRIGMGGGNTNLSSFGSGSGFNVVSNDPLSTYRAFTYSDQGTQKAVDQLDKALMNALYTTTTTGGNIIGSLSNIQPTTTRTLNINKIDKDLRPFLDGNEISIGRSGVSMLDALNDTQRTNILNKVAAATGIPADELAKKYTDYHYANKVFFDPSGTNYADLMRSAAAQDVRRGVRAWSGEGENISKANQMLSRENLAKEYTDRDLGVTAEAPVKEITDSSGNKFYAVYNPTTGTQFVSLDKTVADTIASGGDGLSYDAKTGTFFGKKDPGEFIDASFYYLNKPGEGIGRSRDNYTAINKMMTIDDFLPAGVSISNATPEQINEARNALIGQQELMRTWKNPSLAISDVGKVHANNKFGLTEESAPIKKDGRHYFVNDQTGEVTSVGSGKVAQWAADETANDKPFFHNGNYFYFDKDDGQLKKTDNQFLAEGESQYSNYLNARNWEQFLPEGVKIADATPEQVQMAKELFTAQQKGVQGLTGKGSVFNFFKSQNLPIPEDFIYLPSNITRDFNTLVNMGIDPTRIDRSLTPENVYKGSIEYVEPDDGGLAGMVSGFVVPALAAAFPQFAPYIMSLQGAYQLSQGDVFGGLMSIAGGTGFLNKVLGGSSALSGLKGSMVDSLTNKFGISADVAGRLVDSGVTGGAMAVHAALTDRNVLEAFATGAGGNYLISSISNSLRTSIPNDSVRNFIASRLGSSVINAIQSGKINLDEILASGFTSGMTADMSSKLKQKP